jgi:hypothetical protein
MDTRVEDIQENGEGIKLKRTYLIWHLAVWVGLFGLGFLFHYIFEWVPWKPWGWLFPVNESMWEHTKLALWPSIILYGIEFGFLRKYNKKILIAKVEAIFVSIIAMLAFYYTVEGAFGASGWALSIGSYVFATVLQQITSYIIMTLGPDLDDKKYLIMNIIALVSLGILIIITIVFTYIQPALPIFYDEIFDTYGFLPSY